MANDIDIKVGVVGGQDILKLSNSLTATSNNVRKLSSDFQAGKITQQAYFLGINQQIPALQKLGLTYKEAQKKVWDFTKAQKEVASVSQLTTKRMSGTGVAVQQLGYQVGDFAVQLQSGTNGFVAFGQQATQLVGVLPLIHRQLGMTAMAAVGLSTVLSIGIPIITAIGYAFTKTKEESDKVSESVKKQKQVYEDLISAIENLRLKRQTLSGGTSEVEQKALNEIYQLELRRSVLQQEAADIQSRINEGVDTALDGQLAAVEASIQANEADQQRLNRLLEINRAEQERLAAVEAAKKATEDAAKKDEYRKNLFHAMAGEMAAVNDAAIAFASIDMAAGIRNALGALQALKLELSPGGQAMMKYGGRGTTSDQPITNQYGDVISTLRSKRPKARPIDVDFGAPDIKKSGGGGKGQTQEEYLQQLIREDEQKRKLIGLSETEQSAAETEFKLREKLRDLKGSVTEEEIQSTLRQIEATNKLIEQESRREEIINSATSTIENAFMSMVDGSKSVSDAFKGMIREILLDIYRQQVAKPIATAISSAIFGSAKGNVFSNGSHVTAYANGGVVGSPTYFHMSGGKTGLMGEAGPEAIMPLKRGSDGKLGVQVSGNGGSNDITVQNVITVTGSDAAMVRAEVAKMIPQITNATKAAVIDARLRGGQMKQAFR